MLTNIQDYGDKTCIVTITSKCIPSVLLKELLSTLTEDKFVYLLYCIHRRIKLSDEYSLKFDTDCLRNLLLDTYKYYLGKYGYDTVDKNLQYLVQNDRCLVSNHAYLHAKHKTKTTYPYVYFANNFFLYLSQPANSNIDTKLKYMKLYSSLPADQVKNNRQLDMVELSFLQNKK